MILFKITPVLLLALIVRAEKKIELQDIEEDNLKNEKDLNYETVESDQEDVDGDARNSVSVEYVKSGLLRYYERPNPTQAPQQRYVQQYAVTESQERSAVTPAPQYGPPEAQQANVNYQTNVPMQIYFVPQYDDSSNTHTEAHYIDQGIRQLVNYPNPESEQQYTNYEKVQPYVAPAVKSQVESYQPPINYASYSAPPSVPTTPAPSGALESYQVPVVQYQTSILAPPTAPSNPQNILSKLYYSNNQYNQGKVVEAQENDIKSQSYYSVQTEVPYNKAQAQEVPRYYNSRTPIREQYTKSISELPRPSALLLRAPPPHLAHIPKALPMHRPWGKPVYSNGGLAVGGYLNRPIESYSQPKRRPASLLDSYIPSSIQIEYLKRGIIKDPLVAYEALSSKRQFSQPPPALRHFEGGFLPNQVFHTGNGGSFYGHYKRSPTKRDRKSRS